MKIDKKYIVPGILLILGVLTVAAVIYSWNVYPDWRDDPAGLVGLMVIALAGAIVIVRGLSDLIKSVLEVSRLLEPKEPGTRDSFKTQHNEYFFACYCAAPGKPELQRAEFDEALWHYLDWLKKETSFARLYTEKPPKGEHPPVRGLKDVFIPLRLLLNTPPSIEEIQAKISPDDGSDLREHRAYLQVMERHKKEGEFIPLEKLLTVGNRLAIIGGAGSGKSTLAAYLSYSLAEAALSGGDLPYELPPGAPILLPIIVPLRSYRYYQREHKVSDLHSFIIKYIDQRSITLHLPGSFFERLLQSSACLLILDGLDEIVSKDDRVIVKERIEQLARSIYPNAFFIVTAREAGYQEHAIFGDDFKRLDVQDLESAQIDLLVDKWCRLLPKLENRSDEIISIITEINNRYIVQGLPALIASPLIVTMVVSARWAEEAELPRERAKLYELVVKAILSSQYTESSKERDEVVNYGGRWEHQRQWLSELAWEMHQGGQATAAVSETRLREILIDTVPSDTLEKFIEAVRYRGSLLEERDELFQFVHLTFQEFLAAHYLFQQKDSILNDLSNRLLDSWWREVLLLVYGYAQIYDLRFAQRYLRWLSSQPGNSSEQLAGLELAGAALLEIAEPQMANRQEQAGLLISALTDPNLRAPGVLSARAGNTLAHLGDPRFDPQTWHLPAEPLLGFVEIPAGPFLMGSNKEDDPEAYDDELDQHSLELPAYYLARYPVTVAHYTAFVTDSGYETSAEDSLRGVANHPVVEVTWYDALAYCRWLDGKLKAASVEQSVKAQTAAQKDFWQGLRDGRLQATLPSEAEWEKAARGVDGRIYPWEGEFDPQKANTAETGLGSTSTVGCFPAGASPYGLQDMSGNVWEWTRSLWGKEWEKPDYRYPYIPSDGREDLSSPVLRVLRGGSFFFGRRYARCALRYRDDPHIRFICFGFRVVVSPFDSGL